MPGRTGRKKPLQVIEDMVTVGSQELVAHAGMAEDQARDIMHKIAMRFCALNARNVIYIPAAISLQLTERDQKVWAAYQEDGPDGVRKFSGERVQQLAFEHVLTIQQIYNIIRLVKQSQAAKA